MKIRRYKTHIFIVLLVFVFYGATLFAYFQSDEWFYFSQFLPLKEDGGIFKAIYKSIFEADQISGGGHLTPVYNLTWYIFNLIFGTSFVPYMLSSISLHAVNALLVNKFVFNLTKSKNFAILSAIFFAANYSHFQAITWVMAFIPTLLSTIFLLLSLISFQHFLIKKNKKKFFYTLLLAILALLTKETAVILFVLLPILGFFQKNKFKSSLKLTGILLLLYIPYRFSFSAFNFFIDRFVLNNQTEPTLTIPLILFRAVTYPLKLLTEVFFPQEIILFIAESLTPLAYPTYAQEQSVRGINYLTFVQSAGSDIIIYSLGIILGIAILLKIFNSKTKLKNVYILSLSIIVSTALPLIMIATYAPWWGYVTFIDSRHIYTASIGAGILFSLLVIKILKRNKKIGTLLIVVWLFSNFIFLQLHVTQLIDTATQRKKIISKIINSIPKSKNVKVIYMKTDAGYYGFANIPPFQTNLGQVLAVKLYDNQRLPKELLSGPYAKGSITGEGVNSEGKNKYGFYLTKTKLFEDIAGDKISPEELYAYKWDSEDNTIIDITNDIRFETEKQKSYVKELSEWNTAEASDFTVKYPRSLISQTQDNKVTLSNGITIEMLSKPPEENLGNYIGLQLASDGEIIENVFTFRNIQMYNGLEQTTIFRTDTHFPVYYVPGPNASSFVTVTAKNIQREVNGEHNFSQELEKIISTIQFPDEE